MNPIRRKNDTLVRKHNHFEWIVPEPVSICRQASKRNETKHLFVIDNLLFALSHPQHLFRWPHFVDQRNCDVVNKQSDFHYTWSSWILEKNRRIEASSNIEKKKWQHLFAMLKITPRFGIVHCVHVHCLSCIVCKNSKSHISIIRKFGIKKGLIQDAIVEHSLLNSLEDALFCWLNVSLWLLCFSWNF